MFLTALRLERLQEKLWVVLEEQETDGAELSEEFLELHRTAEEAIRYLIDCYPRIVATFHKEFQKVSLENLLVDSYVLHEDILNSGFSDEPDHPERSFIQIIPRIAYWARRKILGEKYFKNFNSELNKAMGVAHQKLSQ